MSSMHRTQVLLEHASYEQLKEEARRTGVSIGHLVRTAVADRYRGRERRTTLLAALGDSAGAWSALDIDGAEYVHRLRTGLDTRWKERGWE